MAEVNPENMLAQVFTLQNLVNYQQGSVVSKTVVNKKTGTVTLFAFDEGQELSEHTAPFDALVYIYDGETEISISGVTSRLKKGQVIVLPANEPHSLKAVKSYKMMLVMIKSVE